jgi:hypothetical protein
MEDYFTNTPEDAAAFERRRAGDAGEYEQPHPSEYEDALNVCGRCGGELLWSEGPFCFDCED